MPDYERTATVEAEPDELFDYLADVRHLPEYFPVMLDATLHGEEEVEVQMEADPAGVRRAHGWLHVDGLERRMEWGATDGPYHGWLQVDPGDVAGSLITIHVFVRTESDRAGQPGDTDTNQTGTDQTSDDQARHDQARDDQAGDDETEDELAEAMENIRRLVSAGAA